MKTLGLYPNPALDSRWCGSVNGVEFKFTVVGSYCSGTGPKFQINQYELKYDHLEKVQVIQAEVLKEYIKKGQLVLIPN